MKITEIKKTVPTTLVGVDGNAFLIMGHFSKHARRADWTKEEIDCVLDEAMNGNYSHLIATIDQFCNDEMEAE